MRLECLEYLRETHGFDWYSRQNDNAKVQNDSAAMADIMRAETNLKRRQHI
jgi:hypothetical protein